MHFQNWLTYMVVENGLIACDCLQEACFSTCGPLYRLLDCPHNTAAGSAHPERSKKKRRRRFFVVVVIVVFIESQKAHTFTFAMFYAL